MYRKDKNVKQSLKHLNDCYIVFEYYTKKQNITENKKDFINLLLKNYINSNNIISNEDIEKIKGLSNG